MSRYIDVDKISWHKITVEQRCCNDRWDETYTVAYQSDINDMRTVNIIHCKNCKYFFSELGGDYGSCTRIQGGDVVKDTDYCSRAKEREDEE